MPLVMIGNPESSVAAADALALGSGEPWHIALRVERFGRDLLCRIEGGQAHVGAVALSEWSGGRVVTRDLSAVGHREHELARFAARRLCRSTRRTVVCVAGIHYDALPHAGIEAVVRTAEELVLRAARGLDERRVLADLRGSDLWSQLTSGIEAEERAVQAFLSAPLEPLLSEQRSRVAADRARGVASEVQLFAPLYLANACLNDCAYCGFRRSAELARRKLDPGRAVEEAAHLAAQGHRSLDLVTGEIPTDAFVDYVAEVVERILASTPIRRLQLNLGALSLEQLRRLRVAGALGYNVYQETYDPGAYMEVHAAGPKRDMAQRLGTAQRALAAGFEAVGLGLLLGLRPLALDLALLARHARILQRAFTRARLGFSLPRIQAVDAGARYRPAHPVADGDFMKAMLYLRREFPDAHLTLTTREDPALRDALIPLGITRASAGVCTAPGGYLEGAHAGAGQFAVRDDRSLAEVAEGIRAAGARVSYG